MSWTPEGSDVVVDYFGQKLVFVPNEAGFDLGYFGSTLMTLEPEN